MASSVFEAGIQKGIDDADAGRTEDADIVFTRLIAKYQAMAEKNAA